MPLKAAGHENCLMKFNAEMENGPELIRSRAGMIIVKSKNYQDLDFI
jgi:hypothetical protein